MPTYVYVCKSCGKRIEKTHGINEEPSLTCPSCAEPLEREISGGSGFILRGEGFYATDYRSDEYRKAEKKEKEVEKGVGGGEEGSGKKGKEP